LASILAREAAGSTGLGGGVALPHARSARLASPLLAVGRTSVPIDFGSADGQPVSLIFLLAASASDPKGHLKALAALSRTAADKKLVRRMLKAATGKDLYGVLAGVPV
jgi:mannitol/fructose-specific phosphotransferase system IIA component (Ntr-type)